MDNIFKFYEQVEDDNFLNAEKLKVCAKRLMGDYCIAKGDFYYQIGEIEFYYYSPSHKDIITYPRQCFQGLWFFHPSGVDLTMQSSVSGMNPSFGGILIRSIIKYNKEGILLKTICGPQKCVYELFDYLNAIDNSIERTPMIKRHSYSNLCNVVPTQRFISFDVEGKNNCEKDDYQRIIHNKAKVKLGNIIASNKRYKNRFVDNKKEEWLITSSANNSFESFCDYLKANYRYYLKDIKWESGYKAANVDKDDKNYKFLLK